ncbi:MAG: hypothetical protein K8R57_04520 [Verrucomicrobia bacterium]|nr:hypothetical protein [Verrucomicrobiota bacterium]
MFKKTTLLAGLASLAALGAVQPVSATTATAFQETCAKQAASGDTQSIATDKGWNFLRAELRHLGVGTFWGEAAAKVSKASSPDKADPLPAIVDFNDQLKAAGVELILLPVPCKAVIYADQVDPAAKDRLDDAHRAFYALLREKGVKVVDLTDLFLGKKTEGPLLYCKTDTHWSPYACELAAKAVKEQIGSPAWLKSDASAFSSRQEARVITGDQTDGKGSEELKARVVSAPAGKSTIDKSSPVLLLGDSHTMVFNAGNDLHGTGAGLADQLALDLGIPVDVIGVRGSGATPARINLLRHIKSEPGYLSGKKVVIWCFAAREFTESTGWSVLKLAQ